MISGFDLDITKAIPNGAQVSVILRVTGHRSANFK
jgi:hypothetical protein